MKRSRKMHTISVVGLGPGHLDEMPVKVYRRIKACKHLYVRTQAHPAVAELIEEGVVVSSFDYIYEELDERFEEVYEQIVAELTALSKDADVLYAVPGHPLVAEKTVQLLLESDLAVEIVGGKSFIDDLFQAVAVDPIEGFQLVDGLDFSLDSLAGNQHLVMMQVFNSFVASDVKLTLMEIYPDEHPVALVSAAGSAEEKVIWKPLFEIDRFSGVDNLLSLYLPPLAETERMRTFAKAMEVTDRLFSEEAGDAWAQSQDHISLLPYLQEEVDELTEAIETDQVDGMINELGDVLLQVLFQAKVGEKSGDFTLADVLESYNQKMYRRVPHVFSKHFSNASLMTAEENWQKAKETERDEKDETR